MTPQAFYNKLYQIVSATPLPFDCGTLCGGACCRDTEPDSGMYLFPREEQLYTAKDSWASLCDTDFFYQKGTCAKLLQCPGRCNRNKRPLACRIFPLVPYIKDGACRVVMDPRAKWMCPLTTLSLDDLAPEFVHQVKAAARLLCAYRETRLFLKAQSRLIDEFYQEP